MTELLKTVVRELLGEEAADDAFILESDIADEDEEALCSQVCGDVCGGLADDVAFNQDGTNDNFTNESLHSQRAGFMCTSRTDDATDGKGNAAAQLVVEALRGALDRAGVRIRQVAPNLLDSASPALLESLVLGDMSEKYLFAGVGTLASDATFALPSTGSSTDDWSDDWFALPGAGSRADDWSDDWSMLSPVPSTAITPVSAAKGGVGFGALQQLRAANLLPSSTKLFQGLPAAARWAEGSPSFFDRLFGRALTRLGLPAMSLSGPVWQ